MDNKSPAISDLCLSTIESVLTKVFAKNPHNAVRDAMSSFAYRLINPLTALLRRGCDIRITRIIYLLVRTTGHSITLYITKIWEPVTEKVVGISAESGDKLCTYYLFQATAQMIELCRYYAGIVPMIQQDLESSLISSILNGTTSCYCFQLLSLVISLVLKHSPAYHVSKNATKCRRYWTRRLPSLWVLEKINVN